MFWTFISGLFGGDARSPGYRALGDNMIISEYANEFYKD
jgi:hypothetical protein